MQDNSKSSSYQQLEQKSKYTNMFLRWFLYFVLILFASYFIFPLYVMVVTSLKTMEEIRQGTLLSWPSGLNFESWACLLYTSPSPRDRQKSRMPSSA